MSDASAAAAAPTDPTGPTPFDLMTGCLPKLADVPAYSVAYSRWAAAAADRDGAMRAVRAAHTADGRTALQLVADRAVTAEKEAAAALETARQAAAAAVQRQTFAVLRSVRALRRMAGLMERQHAVLYARLAEHVTAAGLVPDPDQIDGVTAADAERVFGGEREAAEEAYIGYGLETLTDWAFDSPAEAERVADEAGAAGAVAVRLVADGIAAAVAAADKALLGAVTTGCQ